MKTMKIKVKTGEGTITFRNVEPGMSVGHAIKTYNGDDQSGCTINIRTQEVSEIEGGAWMGGTITSYPSPQPTTHVVVHCNISYEDGGYVDFIPKKIPVGCKMKATFVDKIEID